MLSIKDLQYYCRTCLVKLEYSHENDSEKSVATKKHPELEQLIELCLAKATAGGDSLCLYVPFLCRSCFDKWLDFVKLYQLAVKTDEKIRIILEKQVLKNESREDDDQQALNEKYSIHNEYFADNEELVDISEIEKCASSPRFFAENLSNSQIPVEPNIEPTFPVKRNLPELDEVHDILGSDDTCSNRSSFIDKTSKSEKSKKTKRSTKKSTISKCLLKQKIYNTRKSNIRSSVKSEASNTVLNEDKGKIVEKNELRKVRYHCESCNKYFWEKIKFEGHMKQIHEGIKRPFQCNQCEKAYNLYKTLQQHKRECHSKKPQETFNCNQCNKMFKTAVILKQHVTNKHSEQKESMRSICDQCGFIAAHQYSLARHIINKHTETDQIKCDQCPKVFKTRYSLKYHILGNHNPMNIKPFKCSECQMGFTRKTLLNQHKRTHLKYTERIKCDFEGCEVRFVKRGDKTHHMRLVHLKVKQHICDFCGEAFGAMQTLRHHRFIHTGEKPYKCNVCGQGFRQRTAMKTHRKTHFAKESDSQDVINNLPEINLSLVNT